MRQDEKEAVMKAGGSGQGLTTNGGGSVRKAPQCWSLSLILVLTTAIARVSILSHAHNAVLRRS